MNPGDEVFHDALDRILEFGRENGRITRFVINTINAIWIGHWIEKIDAGRARAAK